MAKRQREWSARARVALIAQLGGKCTDCGVTEQLEFHHKFRRDWVAAKTELSHRISIYRREAANGLIELLCAPCNKKHGKPQCPF